MEPQWSLLGWPEKIEVKLKQEADQKVWQSRALPKMRDYLTRFNFLLATPKYNWNIRWLRKMITWENTEMADIKPLIATPITLVKDSGSEASVSGSIFISR